MRFYNLSIRLKILIVNVGVTMLCLAPLGLIPIKLQGFSSNMEAQVQRNAQQDALAQEQSRLMDVQSRLLDEQLRLQDERSRVDEILDQTNEATIRCLYLTYWLTDLALSMQQEAEREAKANLAALTKALDRLQKEDPTSVAAVKNHAAQFEKTMLEAVESYTDENRVMGNSKAALARAQANKAMATLTAMQNRSQKRMADISHQLTATNARIREAEEKIATASKQMGDARSAVGDATSRLASGKQELQVWTIICAVVALTLSIVISRWLANSLTRRMSRTLTALEVVAAGDLTRHDKKDADDEMGRMTTTLNATVDGLRTMVKGINENASGIAVAAQGLTAVSTQMTGNAKTASDQADQAATAATGVASSIQTCASGIEEMSASVVEISQTTVQAASIAQEGVSAVREADATMGRLGTSSAEIGSIVSLITSIAEQTNLLALNATIEAARAGESGRGFAVVAGEVKNLARQTSEATADIGRRVATIQSDSTSAQAALQRISEIVNKINELQSSIAAAVEEQSVTTKEISRNLSEVAKAGSDISQNVNVVASAAKESSIGARDTLKAATDLARLAEELRKSVGRFQT